MPSYAGRAADQRNVRQIDDVQGEVELGLSILGNCKSEIVQRLLSQHGPRGERHADSMSLLERKKREATYQRPA